MARTPQDPLKVALKVALQVALKVALQVALKLAVGVFRTGGTAALSRM